MHNLNLNFLKIFYEVANSKSFYEASTKLYITQPAISRSISKLEQELGVKLFYRESKGVSLTSYGQVLYKYIKESSNLLESCQRVLTSMQDEEEGKIILGVQSHIVRNYLMPKIIDFIQKHPNVTMKFVDLPTKILIEELEKGHVDFVIDTSPVETVYNNVNIKPITELDTCFIKSVDNNENITCFEDLQKRNLILPVSRSSLRKNLNLCFINKELDIKPTIEFATEELIVDAVRADLGVGYVVKPTSKEFIEHNKLDIIDIKEDLPKVEINLVSIDRYMTNISKLFIEEELEGDMK